MCKFKIVKTVSLPFLRLPKRSASREKWEGGGGGETSANREKWGWGRDDVTRFGVRHIGILSYDHLING
jgi:hypothetical protein